MKNKMFLLLHTLLSFYLVGCNFKKEDRLSKAKSLSFEVPFIPQKTGFFYDKDSLYFYDYNFSTYKNLEVRNQNGKVFYNIDLSKLKLKTDEIKVEMHSLDSIYILGTKSAEICLLNKNGILLKRIRVDSLIHCKTEYTKNRCKYSSISSHGDMVRKNNAIFKVNIIDTAYKDIEDLYQSCLAANRQVRKNPQLVYIKNLLDTNCTVILEPSWIGKVIKEEDEDFNMTPFYLYLNDKIVFCLSHDRHIYFVKPEDLTFEKKIPVFSQYTELEYKKPKLSKKGVETQNPPYVFYAMYKGAIMDIHYEKDKYFVLVKHEMPLPEKEEMITLPDMFDARYSVIIYDKEWKKEKEVLLPAQEKFIAFIHNHQIITQTKSKNPRNIMLNFYHLSE